MLIQGLWGVFLTVYLMNVFKGYTLVCGLPLVHESGG